MPASVAGSARLAISIVALALGPWGCAGSVDNLPRKEVTGTVTLDSAPLPRGTIQFLPAGAGSAAPPAQADAEAATKGGQTAASVPITEGKFRIERANGLTPGSYKVQVYGTDLTSAASDAPPGLEPAQPKETIPRRYNVGSKLTAEVKEEGPNTFDFHLTK